MSLAGHLLDHNAKKMAGMTHCVNIKVLRVIAKFKGFLLRFH